MDNKEALAWCDQFRDNIIKSGDNRHKYNLALNAMTTAMDALAKQIPQKVENYACPNCYRLFLMRFGQRKGEDFCDQCGQALDWGDTNG